MAGASSNDRLGVKRHPEAGPVQHRQVVGAVAHGDHLLQSYAHLPGHPLHQRGLALAVDDLPLDPPREAPVADLELVGRHAVDPEPLLQPAGEVGEPPREYADPVTEPLQGGDQPLRPLGDRQPGGDLLQHRRLQTLEQGQPAPEALLEVELAAHRRLGDRRHLLADPGRPRQLVDHLDLDERRVHVEDDEAPVAPKEVVRLEGHVHLLGPADLEQVVAQPREVGGLPPQGELDAGPPVGVGLPQGEAAREPGDAVDVDPVGGDDAGDAGEYAGAQLAPEQGHDVAGLPLQADPLLVGLLVDRREVNAEPQLVRLEEQVLQHRAGAGGRRQLQQHAEGEVVVDHRLADVQYVDGVVRQHVGQCGRQAGVVLARHVEQDDLSRQSGPSPS